MKLIQSSGLVTPWASLVVLITLSVSLNLANAQTQTRRFPETGKSVGGRFLQYWSENGGIPGLGLPISEQFSEQSELNGRRYTLQYFERAVLEMHPENARPYDVLLMRLGALLYAGEYPRGAPGQRPNDSTGSLMFPQTNKRLSGVFLRYWDTNGGLARFGYPLSDEFTERSLLDGADRTVQYFERATFEHHADKQPPYNVLLAHHGSFRHRARYAAQSPTPSQIATVQIQAFRFHPADITVKTGSTVTWVQRDVEPHNVAGIESRWSSTLMECGETFSRTFLTPGTYRYLCEPHPRMQGRVLVIP